ncbi:MAG TPA: hypothetical protein VIV88_15390 [Gemmatimonadales bacterium]|jgi:hypothetical protein
MTAATLMVAGACNEPHSPKAVADLVSPNYPLAVSTTSTGFDIDSDGYVVWVDNLESQPVSANGVVTFNEPSGPHEVALYGVAANCTVGGFNPRMVFPGSDLVAATAFTVTCRSQGDLYVSTSTTGVDLDPDGYTVTVDGGASQPIASNGAISFTGVATGSHTVALSGIAGNCSVTSANPQTVTVTAGATTGAPFSLSCAPTGSGSGTLTIATSTTGSNLDSDGYSLTVDGTTSRPIATNGRVTLAVAAGAHPVALSGVAANCVVGGANPRTVSVPAGGTATTTFAVTCNAQLPPPEVGGQGQIGMGPATPGDSVLTFAFDLRADLTGRFTATDYGDIHPSGTPASITTDPATDPATSITAYRNSSSACGDPSRGVEVDAVGREDAGQLVSYTVQLCDNGPAGSGSDFWSIFIPSEGYGHSGSVTSGDIVKR